MSKYQPYYSSYQPHDSLFADDALALRVATFLSAQPIRGAERLRLSVNAGRVTLRGRLISSSHRAVIEACCRRVAGVLSVNNRITVADTLPGRVPSHSDSAGRAAPVRLALAGAGSVSSFATCEP